MNAATYDISDATFHVPLANLGQIACLVEQA